MRLRFAVTGLALLAGSLLWFAVANFWHRGGDGGAAWVDAGSELLTVWLGYLGSALGLLGAVAAFASTVTPQSATARRVLTVAIIAAVPFLVLYTARGGFG